MAVAQAQSRRLWCCAVPHLSVFQNPCPSLAKQGAGDEARSKEGRGGLINAATHGELITEDCADGWAVRVLLARTITDLALLAPAGVEALFARHSGTIAMRRHRCVDVLWLAEYFQGRWG
jgi:hypothetical protein